MVTGSTDDADLSAAHTVALAHMLATSARSSLLWGEERGKSNIRLRTNPEHFSGDLLLSHKTAARDKQKVNALHFEVLDTLTVETHS